jgi:multiple sugar transport system permease protein
MLVFPVGYTLYFSVHEWFASSASPPVFVGLDNFLRMAGDERFLLGLARTLGYTVVSVAGALVLGTALALLLNRSFPGRGIVRSLFMLPMMATPVAISLVWLLMYDPSLGVLNYFLSLFGMQPRLWVNDPQFAMLWLIVVDIWEWTPLIMLIALGGLASLPSEPFEAAYVDGASTLQIFRHVTLPLLRPYLVIAVLFRGIDALKTFDQIYVITGGGPGFATETLNIYIYRNAFEYLHIGYASAMLVVFFLIVTAISMLLIRARRGAW